MGEAIRVDLNDTGIRVTTIEPGAVETPSFDNPTAAWRPTTSPAP